MTAENGNISTRRLGSWKEIAAFLGRDERTVKRWETSRGLPVRRVPGAGRASVFAYPEEIEDWLRRSEIQQPGTAIEAPSPEGPPGLLRRGTLAWVLIGAVTFFGGAIYFELRGTARDAALRSSDAIAEQSYRLGLHEWQTRTPSGLHHAIADFRKAIARDPRFAEAWVGLADAYNLEGEFSGAPQDRDYSSAMAAARQAIALDPSLAGGHAAFAFAEFYGARDIPLAEKEFRRAVTLDPQSAVAHHWYATFLMTIGSFNGALAEIAEAERLDAESTAIPADKALIFFHAGRTTEAIRLLRQLEEDNPGFAAPHSYLSTIALTEGDDATYVSELKAAALLRRDKVDTAVADAATNGLATGGHIGMLRALFDIRREFFTKNQVSAYALATTCAALNDDNGARSYLATSVARRETDNIILLVDPPFERFHGSDWFRALLARAGLAQAGNSSGLPVAPQNR